MTFAWGTTNFIYGRLDDQDFATQCLQFSGYLTVCIIYKMIDLRKSNSIERKQVLHVFFQQFYDFNTKKFNYVNLIHLAIRAVNFFLLATLIIWSSYYALLAEINFGIVSSAICIGAPLNCIFSKIFWGENLSPRMIVGTTLIICGVVWVALAKGAPIAT